LQQINKKGKLIHDAQDIKYIIERLNMVDKVVIAIGEEKSVCKTLEVLKPDIFANGGDRTSENIPEIATCKKHNIKMIFGIGKEKTTSSSELISKTGI